MNRQDWNEQFRAISEGRPHPRPRNVAARSTSSTAAFGDPQFGLDARDIRHGVASIFDWTFRIAALAAAYSLGKKAVSVYEASKTCRCHEDREVRPLPSHETPAP